MPLTGDGPARKIYIGRLTDARVIAVNCQRGVLGDSCRISMRPLAARAAKSGGKMAHKVRRRNDEHKIVPGQPRITRQAAGNGRAKEVFWCRVRSLGNETIGRPPACCGPDRG